MPRLAQLINVLSKVVKANPHNRVVLLVKRTPLWVTDDGMGEGRVPSVSAGIRTGYCNRRRGV